jgi:ABC-type Na+ transport system ATPase subunit NatA
MEFRDKFRHYPLEKLVGIVNNPNAYIKEAYAAACEELSNRNIPKSTIDAINQQFRTQNEIANRRKMFFENISTGLKKTYTNALSLVENPKNIIPFERLNGVGLIIFIIGMNYTILF